VTGEFVDIMTTVYIRVMNFIPFYPNDVRY